MYKKAVYKQYTSGTYTSEVPKPEWLGFLGPVIRAEVGDDIVVHMKNFATRPYSIHPHGVFYEKDSEGSNLYWCVLGGLCVLLSYNIFLSVEVMELTLTMLR